MSKEIETDFSDLLSESSDNQGVKKYITFGMSVLNNDSEKSEKIRELIDKVSIKVVGKPYNDTKKQNTVIRMLLYVLNH